MRSGSGSFDRRRAHPGEVLGADAVRVTQDVGAAARESEPADTRSLQVSVEDLQQVLPSRVAALRDESDGMTSRREVVTPRDANQVHEVRAVVEASRRLREALERDEMPNRRRWNDHTRGHRFTGGSSDDLRLDAGRRKQQIYPQIRVEIWSLEPGSAKAMARSLLDECANDPSGLTQCERDLLGFGVVLDRHHEVQVSGETRLSADVHCQPTDEGIAPSNAVQPGDRFRETLRDLVRGSSGRSCSPGLSGPFLSSSQACIIALRCVGDAAGFSRAIRSRVDASPQAIMSSDSLKR